MMKLFLLKTGLNFLKVMFQKILFYFTVSHDVLYEKFHDNHNHHTWSLSNIQRLLMTCKLLPYLHDVVKCKRLPNILEFLLADCSSEKAIDAFVLDDLLVYLYRKRKPQLK